MGNIRRLMTVSALLLAAFGHAQKLQVVTTIHPYYSLVNQLGGDLVEATRLLPVGTSPHNFDPSPRDVVRVAQADLLIRNGGIGLDEWVLRLVEASETDARLLTVMDAIEFVPLGTSAHSHEEDHSHDHDHPDDSGSAAHHEPLPDGHFVNTHIWLDVTIAMSAAEAIAASMIELDPGNGDVYRANLRALLEDLRELDQELLEVLEPVRGAVFVPFHDAWPYFARRYGLNLLVEIEPFPGREPSPDYLVHSLGLIRDSGATAIFSERQLSPRPAQVVAAEAGLPLYVLDPEGGGDSAVESYQDLLRFNARVLLEALSH